MPQFPSWTRVATQTNHSRTITFQSVWQITGWGCPCTPWRYSHLFLAQTAAAGCIQSIQSCWRDIKVRNSCSMCSPNSWVHLFQAQRSPCERDFSEPSLPPRLQPYHICPRAATYPCPSISMNSSTPSCNRTQPSIFLLCNTLDNASQVASHRYRKPISCTFVAPLRWERFQVRVRYRRLFAHFLGRGIRIRPT